MVTKRERQLGLHNIDIVVIITVSFFFLFQNCNHKELLFGGILYFKFNISQFYMQILYRGRWMG